MTLIDALAVLILAAVPFNWAVAAFMARLLRRNPDLATLRSRTLTQVVLAVCATLGGLLALSHFFVVRLSPDAGTATLAALILLPSVPGIFWTWEYSRGRLR